jgi:hypothetical protein
MCQDSAPCNRPVTFSGVAVSVCLPRLHSIFIYRNGTVGQPFLSAEDSVRTNLAFPSAIGKNRGDSRGATVASEYLSLLVVVAFYPFVPPGKRIAKICLPPLS